MTKARGAQWGGGGSGLDGLEVGMTLQCSWDSTSPHIGENLQFLVMVWYVQLDIIKEDTISLYFRPSLPTLQIICSCSAFVTCSTQKYLLYRKVMKARGTYSVELGVAGSGSGMEVGVAWRWEWHGGRSGLEVGVA